MALITISGLYKSYGTAENPVEVLKGIDLSIEEGETIAVVGASGAGKSTLLNVIGALDRPTKGMVLFGNKPIFAMDEKGLSRFRNKLMGFVFQFHHLLQEFTAVENVMLPALISGESFTEAKRKSESLLKEVGLGERLSHKPGELSGGEQQRCAIVRALILSPRVILADEPTGNLDAKTGMETFELLLRFNREKNITLIVVTHNEKLAGLLKRKITMADGRLIEQT